MDYNDWIDEFEKRAGPRLRSIFEKDLDGMPPTLARQLERLRQEGQRQAGAAAEGRSGRRA